MTIDCTNLKPGDKVRLQDNRTLAVAEIISDLIIRLRTLGSHHSRLDGKHLDGCNNCDIVEILTNSQQTQAGSEATIAKPIYITISLAQFQQIKTALEAGLEAARNEHQEVTRLYGGNRPRLVSWHADQISIIEQALEQINAKLNPPSHPT
jgi:hypothetical protein